MLISEADAEAEIALRIGALQLDGDGLLLVAGEEDVGVHVHAAVDHADLAHVYVDELEDSELGERLVGALHARGAVWGVGQNVALLLEDVGADEAVGVAVEDGDVLVADRVGAGKVEVARRGIVGGCSDHEVDVADRVGDVELR